ncbi:PRC-barrel domain-containing protein [Metallumcola ferriviriculae]|uniref:PRC-barrel domain-containing protein n=1 Tax=Metallumcola ferriviriculae TaxID=3039180 RepID=A0AAU0UIY8_9FIRM|nr:PRC-barrel domain-containing protein [Desulfitibacteraceae bacterium MK1]
MLASTQLIGLPVIALSSGNQIGIVKKIVFHPDKRVLAALVLEEDSNQTLTLLLEFQNIKGIGDYAVTTVSSKSIRQAKELPELMEIMEKQQPFKGRRVVTENGQLLGSVERTFIDPVTGQISALELSGSMLATALKGRLLLPGQFLRIIGTTNIVTTSKAARHLQPAPTKFQKTLKKVQGSSSQTWETTKRWANSLGKTIQEVTADDKPDDEVKQ